MHKGGQVQGRSDLCPCEGVPRHQTQTRQVPQRQQSIRTLYLAASWHLRTPLPEAPPAEQHGLKLPVVVLPFAQPTIANEPCASSKHGTRKHAP